MISTSKNDVPFFGFRFKFSGQTFLLLISFLLWALVFFQISPLKLFETFEVYKLTHFLNINFVNKKTKPRVED